MRQSHATTLKKGPRSPRPSAAEQSRPLKLPAAATPPPGFWPLICLAAVAIVAAYANHFHNSFHFDDSHTVVDNAYIRSLRYIPRYFSDARTFSSLPANQTWRPLVSVSLALDYRLGGLNPLWFHVSTFFWFLTQLALMFLLYRTVLDRTVPGGPGNAYVALFAVLWYGLHPAIAETVNYIIQRADLYATLGVVAALVVYTHFPALRKFGLYLLPVVLGALCKAPAVVFCAILFVYIFLFEEDADWRRFWLTFRRTIPALIACAVLAYLDVKMTSASYVPSTMPKAMYWASQPLALMRYVRSFFLPFWLSADSDLQPVLGFSDPRAWLGLVFCAAMLAAGFSCIKRRERRPIAFGIFWYFFASAPTSLFVLAEVENDHRMFFPFVGLTLSVTWALALYLTRRLARHPEQRAGLLVAVKLVIACLLFAYAAGTWKRNTVWRSEESLWRDETIKSPESGRGLMNYGLTQMNKGDAQTALQYFQRAAVYTPYYYTLEINTGIAYSLLNNRVDAEVHLRRAIELAPQSAQPYFYYARWLRSQGQTPECIQAAKSAIERNSDWLEPRYLLMQTYAAQSQKEPLRDLALDTLKLVPGDPEAQRNLLLSENMTTPLAAAEKLAQEHPTPENYLSLSLLYHQAANYQACIDAARKALKLKPDYPEAYNNLAAAYEAMSQWDQAIQAAQQAVRLKPDFTLAKNNLAFSLAQKKIHSRQ